MRYVVQVQEFNFQGIKFKQGDELDALDTVEIRANVALGRLKSADELELPSFLKRKTNARSRV
jgi:hypothetical protein